MVKFIAEIGVNHNGSVDITKKLIDVAADAGCQYVKFQKRDIDVVYSKEELEMPRESPWGKTNKQQKLGLEFNLEQYQEIDSYCKEKSIEWFASCWDENSVDFIEENFPDVPFHKVASAKATDLKFLEKLKETGKPLIASTGMLNYQQTTKLEKVLGENLAVLMHCTSTYPTRPEEMNISFISTLLLERELGNCKYDIGFSNHYSGLLWVPIAITLGAEFLEFHITLDRTMYGTDQAASIEPEGVKKLVTNALLTKSMLGDGLKKVYDSELPIAKKLRKVNDF